MAARLVRSSALATFVVFAVVLSLHAAVITVNSAQDSLTLPGCTLRKAIINANTDSAAYPDCAAGSGLDTINFSSAFTITIAIARANQDDDAASGDFNITQSVIIEGGGTTIDGAALDRVFHVIGTPGTPVTATLRNLWLRNGRGVEGGGGVWVDGATVNLENVTISGCVASAEDGGGIKVINAGTLNATNCTISGNSSVVHGGGIAIDDSQATATITSCTITANSGGFSNTTGGVHNTGTCSLRNTIVAGNSGTDVPNLNGIYTSNGFNIIGNMGTNPGDPQITATTGDQFGVNAADLHLGPLQNNGGPVPTIELQTGSIAIDQGHSSGSTTDARGLTRPCDLAAVPNVSGGDGGDVGAFEVQGTCAAANHDPVAVDDSATVLHDSGANTIDVLSNDSDVDGDTLSVTAVTQGAHGTVANNTTSVSYTPALHFVGSDSFTYTISDGKGGTATASVNVTVINHPPVANGDSYTINQDTVLNVAAPGVLGNDTDVDGDALTASLVSGPSHGSVSLAADGSFSYTPAPSFAGSDSFTYRAFDGIAYSNSATVSITILDTEPPAITISLGTSLLWPPEHDLLNVGFTFTATDNSSGAIATSVDVFSNEDDVTGAGGDESPDAKSIASGTLRLRAERDANGNGRVYLIRVTATDASSNTSHSCVAAVVPKSLSAADVAGVNAMAQAAVSVCNATGNAPSGWFVVGDGPVVGPKQ